MESGDPASIAKEAYHKLVESRRRGGLAERRLMTRATPWLALLLAVGTVAMNSSTLNSVLISDFSSGTNDSAIIMEWTDAAGVTHLDHAAIPPQADSSSGGAFPMGFLRYRNLGSGSSSTFDLLVTAKTTATHYSSLMDVEYITPTSSTASQAGLTPVRLFIG